jgi:Flp pilus assembly pilin Flp
MYRALGFAHATAVHHLHSHQAHRRFGDEEGQGTVEYVGLILLLAGVMVAVVKAGHDGSIADTVVRKIKDSIDNVGDAPRKG